jgi:protein involved in polysaccharide export with SLBB domain
MKITFNFGFSGGRLEAECESFDEADALLQYAVHRGIITVNVTTPEGDVVQADVTAAPTDDAPFENAVELEKPPFDEVTVEAAQQAVKDYAAKNGIEAGRSLLAKFGFKRTNEITADKAGEIVGACHE